MPSKGFPLSFPIVGIGASAGGLEAFTAVLQELRPDTNMGFVLVQHLDPDHESALTQLLTRTTQMPVVEARHNLRVEPNHVYVIPPNANLCIEQGVLKLGRRARGRTPHRSIDMFFESLARDQGDCAIGVVLSGAASDGTLGLEAIKTEGGFTIAQDESARYDSMPRNAIAAGCVDLVLSPADIARELARISRHPCLSGGPLARFLPEKTTPAGASPSAHGPRAGELERSTDPGPQEGGPTTAAGRVAERALKKIFLLLRNRSSVDFSLYKSTTIRRRIMRRMVLNRKNTLRDYAGFLRGNSKELDALYSDILINVTSFFRNPEAFDVLKRKVFPSLLRERRGGPVRIWVLGCSAGQEAYSMAMAFLECADSAVRPRKLQVFATDLNEALLEKARQGLYPRSLSDEISPERLRRFFVEEAGGYRISKSLREMVVFARQNLIGDPPFSRMDLISCRNVLIYLDAELQKRVFPTFHYALKPTGFLFLGGSESVGTATDLFEPADKKHKIYSRKAVSNSVMSLPAKRSRLNRQPSYQKPPAPAWTPRSPAGSPSPGLQIESNAQREADRLTVNAFAPPGVLINSDLQILQFRGPTSAYLKPPSGNPSFDVLKMARDDLMLPLRSAINKARKQNKITRKEVRLTDGGKARLVELEVIPLKNLRDRCFLVLFGKPGQQAPDVSKSRGSKRAGGGAGTGAKKDSQRIAELELELSETRDYLQSIQEQHEATNEELQASNEEIQSANEELQSINEEMETSKEELESTNEELTTVNEEMANRNADLIRLNNDLANLQSSTKLAMLLLGRDLVVRRFSAPAQKVFNLTAADVGRPLSSVRHTLDISDLESLTIEVIASVREREREVRDKQGRWYFLRVRPYLTLENIVDGAVLVLVDIDALKQNELAIASARDYAESIVETVREPLVVLDADLHVESANRSFYRAFHSRPSETVGKSIFDLDDHRWDIPRLRSLLAETLHRSSVLENFEVRYEVPRLGHRTMVLNARRLEDPTWKRHRILLAIEDITERQQLQHDLQSARMSEAIVASARDPVVILETDLRVHSANDAFYNTFKIASNEVVGRYIHEIANQQWDDPQLRQFLNDVVPRNSFFNDLEITREFERLGRRTMLLYGRRLVGDGARERILLGIQDVTEMLQFQIAARKSADALRRSEGDLRDFLENAAVGLHWVGPDGIILWANQTELDMLGYSRDEYVGHPIAEFHADADVIDDILSRLARAETICDYTARLRCKDASVRHVQINSNVLFEHGRFIHTRCFTRDVTARTIAEQKLNRALEFDQAVMTHMGEGLYTVDKEGKVTYMNPAAETLFGWSSGELHGRKMHDATHYKHPDGTAFPAEECAGFKVLQNGASVTDQEDVFIRKDGTFFDVVYSSSPLREGNEIVGLVVVFRDVTQRKQADASLQLAQKQLADRAGQLERLVAERTMELTESNKQLEAFVYSIAHDLRAPLRSMEGFSAVLVEEAGKSLSPTAQAHAQRINRSARFMDALLQDLLSFSRISQQHIELAAVHSEAVLRGVLLRLEKEIQDAGALIETAGPWPAVLAHEPTLGQVLFNLISNSLKFVAPNNPPVVRIWMEERVAGPSFTVSEKGRNDSGHAEESWIRFWVEDNGIGINPNHHEEIFRLFTRLNGERFPGTGIGLAIVQKGIERMGGRVGVESTPGRGCRFWLDLRKA
ncbi:MAG: two-component system, chemotaxis family, CheB/CheR fusion protein [Verrucomicrobiota bacterium]